ncbi:hypothetical protein SAMN05421676_105223 [Salinibacillus kushneri]|uniref:Zinicin-like metallopeptidase n=1 Tax=Salinibacillus kushneri TaxID=237682 RepID=A0A1I0F914_9BACI|nr:hypothetical protein [Salinibacillus kushneri]SET53607.1 hypothetical protein SAMN05421676_105223 [Salinibacillus kushneri]
MKQIFAFENIEDYEKYQNIIERFNEKLKNYQVELERNYALRDLPKAIVWTTEELATTVFSNVPIPAYINKNIMYITPDIYDWRNFFNQPLKGLQLPKIKAFYENLSENHLFTIVAHELTHHSDLFVDEFDGEREDSIWFEEGMCDYLSRKLTLSDREFHKIQKLNRNW